MPHPMHTPACPQTLNGFDLHALNLHGGGITEKVVSAACERRGGGEEGSGNDMSPLGVTVPIPYN